MKDEEKFRRNRELELKHGRICVLVAPGHLNQLFSKRSLCATTNMSIESIETMGDLRTVGSCWCTSKEWDLSRREVRFSWWATNIYCIHTPLVLLSRYGSELRVPKRNGIHDARVVGRITNTVQ